MDTINWIVYIAENNRNNGAQIAAFFCDFEVVSVWASKPAPVVIDFG